MWNRQNLKEAAKKAFKNNYWVSVVSALILGAVIAGVATYVSVNTGSSVNESFTDGAVTVGSFAGVASIVTLLINVFVCRPLEIGGRQFFLNNSEGRANISDFIRPFQTNYMNNVLTMFLRDLFIGLWSLLLIVPGIIKTYAYSMVPYILAENPQMDAMEAIRLSERMMKGHKWNAFVLDLSFIGWFILSGLTLGLVGVFYVNPYFYATDAELYKAIKAEYVSRA